mmetsp:Transcript_28802/g.82472  ORF Transcript_28802/g.82472 Transcript_28802/m.82472 type:complete len:218 (+) Transcript_28802:476-1129(+)
MPDCQVCEVSCWRPVSAVDDGRGGVGSVDQQTRRLAHAGRDEADARHTPACKLYLELELKGVVLTGLKYMDAAAFGASQEEGTCVIEGQRTHLRLDLQLLQHHAIEHVHQPQDCIRVCSHKNLRVEGQEEGHGHRRGVGEDLQHLTCLNAPEAHRLVNGGGDKLILEHAEEAGGDGARVAHKPRVDHDVAVGVIGLGRYLVVGRVILWREVHVAEVL